MSSRCEVCSSKLPDGAERFCPAGEMQHDVFNRKIHFAGCEPLSIDNFAPDRQRACRNGERNLYHELYEEEYALLRYGGRECAIPRNGGERIRGNSDY